MRSANPHALAALTSALAYPDDILRSLAHTSVPTLLLAGDQDSRLPLIRRTAAQIPSARLIEIPDCGHLDTFQRKDLTLPTFCRSCPATPPNFRDSRRFGARLMARAGPHADRSFGPVAVAKAYRLLRAIFTSAAGDGLIRRNPCRTEIAGREDSPERGIVPDLHFHDLMRTGGTLAATTGATLRPAWGIPARGPR
jgi:hypothetical protein